MAKASDNVFPKVQFSEEAAPATPTSGQAVVYVKADGKLYLKDDAGAETDLTATGGGGGGGDSYAAEPGLKPPDSGDANDKEFDNANGTDPTTLGLSWGNQGSATAEVRGGRLAINIPGSDPFVARGLFVAAPSGDFTVATRAVANLRARGNGNAQDFWLALLWGTLATPTRIEVVRLLTTNDTENFRVAATRWSDYTTFTTDHAAEPSDGGPLYLRLGWDDIAEEVTFEWTRDPAAWEWATVATVAGPGTAPDFVGVAVSTASILPVSGFFSFLRFNWTPDYSA